MGFREGKSQCIPACGYSAVVSGLRGKSSTGLRGKKWKGRMGKRRHIEDFAVLSMAPGRAFRVSRKEAGRAAGQFGCAGFSEENRIKPGGMGRAIETRLQGLNEGTGGLELPRVEGLRLGQETDAKQEQSE
jgi:hypothetical protein